MKTLLFELLFSFPRKKKAEQKIGRVESKTEKTGKHEDKVGIELGEYKTKELTCLFRLCMIRIAQLPQQVITTQGKNNGRERVFAYLERN